MGCRVIEVGAGCGLTSIYATLRGADVTITDMDTGGWERDGAADAEGAAPSRFLFSASCCHEPPAVAFFLISLTHVTGMPLPM